MVDVSHLPTPFHVRMRGFLLALALPGAPDRDLLLSDANQHHFFLAFLSRSLQKRTRDFLLVLPFLEPYHGNTASFGELMDGLDISLSNLAEGRRGGNFEFPSPAKEDTHLADRLEFGH